MLSRLLIAAVLVVPSLARADDKGEIDWSRRVIKTRGQGAPDLSAPSISVARIGAERAARADAMRNLLELLKGATVEGGARVGTLLQNDQALTVKVRGALRGFRVVPGAPGKPNPHYYSDGGVALDVELPLDALPEELTRGLKAPEGAAAARPSSNAPASIAIGEPRPDREGDFITQEAQGQAAVLSGDKPAAREKAIEDALRQAVSMAAGTQVTATTEVENFQTKLDEILTRASGFVKGFDIVKESMDGDVVQVTVRARVSMAALDKDLEAAGLLMSRKGKPRTMLLIGEQNIGMTGPYEPWRRETKAVGFDLRVGENVMLDELQKKGFKVVDPEIAAEKAASVGGISHEITAQQARQIKKLTSAEVIVVGKVIALARGSLGDLGPEWRSCTATMTARAVNTDNGDILASAETTQQAAALDDVTCGKEAIKKAAKAFTGDITAKILARWNQDVSGGNSVRVTIKNVSSAGVARQFRTALTQHVRGVKGVSQRSFGDGVAELDVTLVGTTEQFAEEIESKKLGSFSVKVKGYSANTVDVELGGQ